MTITITILSGHLPFVFSIINEELEEAKAAAVTTTNSASAMITRGKTLNTLKSAGRASRSRGKKSKRENCQKETETEKDKRHFC